MLAHCNFLGTGGRAAAWASLLAAAACTSNPWAGRPPPSDFLVVAGAVIPDYQGSSDTQSVPFLVTRTTLGPTRLEIEGIQARLDVLEDPVWRAGPALSVSLARDERVDAPEVLALPDLETALELGAFGGLTVPPDLLPEDRLTATLSLRQGVTSTHQGQIATAELDYFFAAARVLRFGVGVESSWISDDYAQTYFGIDAAQSSASGLPEFDAAAGFRDLGVELYSILSFSEEFGLFGRVAWNRLRGDAADSPLTSVLGSTDQTFVGGGLFWRF